MDNGEFVVGLCTALSLAQGGVAAWLITIISAVDQHHLGSEHVVQFGVVISETIPRTCRAKSEKQNHP